MGEGLDEWRKFEPLLESFDPQLRSFAERSGMAIRYNGRQWPSRGLECTGANNVAQKIQLYVSPDNPETVSMWICAWQDRVDGRYWAERFLLKDVPPAECAVKLDQLLKEARNELDYLASHPEQLQPSPFMRPPKADKSLPPASS